MEQRFFKGWAKPGPACRGGVAVEPGETLDAISGDFRLFQLRDGHRFSTDDLLAAYYGTTWCPSAARVLELGSGIGSVGMIAAWRLVGARFVTLEAQEESVRLARKSVVYNGLETRCDVRHGDFRDASLLQGEAGFDLVLGSPPYFPEGGGEFAEHPQKRACRFELRGNIADYAMTAAAHLSPGGIFACVFPIQPEFQHQRVRVAARDADLCIVRWRPVILKQGEAPLLGVFAMSRMNDLPGWFRNHTWQEPALVIRATLGHVHPEYMALKLMLGFPP